MQARPSKLVQQACMLASLRCCMPADDAALPHVADSYLAFHCVCTDQV